MRPSVTGKRLKLKDEDRWRVIREVLGNLGEKNWEKAEAEVPWRELKD